MSFRSKIFFVLLAAALVPLIALAAGIRSEMTRRLSAQYTRRVDALAGVIRQDIAREREVIAGRLAAIRRQLDEDNRFRLAVVRPGEERRYLLDLAGEAMSATGLDFLQIQNDEGRILSSGHFRNDFDRLDPRIISGLARHDTMPVAAQIRTATESFPALARIDSFTIGNRRLYLAGGIRFDQSRLRRMTPDGELAVSLVLPDTVLSTDTTAARILDEDPDPAESVVARIPMAWVNSAEPGTAGSASLVITQQVAGLAQLRRGVDRWVLMVAGAAVIVVILASAWLAARVTRPLRDLAHATERIDLERLRVDLPEERSDEIGALARVLHEMTSRLQAGTVRIREAERRAATG
ncbi:MAG: HAMP domain-containing protein, partial [Gemmatimonadales bacterium]